MRKRLVLSIPNKLKSLGWLMIHESGVYSHPEINGGYPFTEQEALAKPPTNDERV